MKSDRVRNIVILVVMTVWVAVVAAYLLQDKLPDAPLLGIPAAIWVAMHPPRFIRGGNDEQQSDEPDPPRRRAVTPADPPAPLPKPATEQGGATP